MGKHGESVNVQFIGETDDEVATAVQIGQYLKPKGFIFLGGSADHFREPQANCFHWDTSGSESSEGMRETAAESSRATSARSGSAAP